MAAIHIRDGSERTPHAAPEPVSGRAPEPVGLTTAHTSGTGTWHREEIYDENVRSTATT